MESKLVSVIVPVYNVERYLEACIKSICTQSYSDIEIILVDDGSTDRSGEICDEWERRDSRIHTIHKENGGLSDARNVGIEQSNGSWLMFVDSDDTISLNSVEQMYCAAVNNNCELAVCNMVRTYDDGSAESFYAPVTELTVWDGQQRYETLKQPSVCNKLFRADLFEKIQFPKGKFYEDTFVYHVLVHRANKIALTGHDGYFYLSRRESIIGQKKYTDRYFDFIEAVYTRMTYLINHQVAHYAEEACLSLYVAVSNGEKYIQKTEDNAMMFQQMYRWYQVAYDHLMRQPDTGIKQRIRLIMLRYWPMLHGWIY